MAPNLWSSALFHHLLPPTPLRSQHPGSLSQWRGTCCLQSWQDRSTGPSHWPEPRGAAGGGIPNAAARTASSSHLATSPALTQQPAKGRGTPPACNPCQAPCTLSHPAYRHWTWPRTWGAACSPDTGIVRVILSSVAQNTQEGCAQWQTEVTQAQSEEKHFRPQDGTKTTWGLKQWGRLLTPPLGRR